MLKKGSPFLFLLFVFLFNDPEKFFSQTRETDSLVAILKTVKEDTSKVNLSVLLSKKLHNIGELDASLQYAKTARDLAIKLNFKKGEAKAYNRIGNICMDYGDIPAALKNHEAALALRKEINDEAGLASSYNDIGNSYYLQGNYLKALESFFASLRLKEKLNDEKALTSAYTNIGNVYYDLGNFKEAIKYQSLSLRLAKKQDNQMGIASAHNNLGIVYYGLHKYRQAIIHNSLSLDICRQIGDKAGMARAYSNIAINLDQLGAFEESIKNCFHALAIHREIGDEQGQEMVYNNLTVAYFNLGKYKEAEEYGLLSLELSEKLDDLKGIKESHQALYHLYNSQEKYKEALLHYNKFIGAKDSLINEENTKKTVRLEMNYIFQKKVIEDSLRSADEKRIVAMELKQEKLQRYGLYSGLAIVLLFAVFMVSRFRVSQKQKKIIEQQKKEVEHQKELVDEKQKEVMDSIYYARRIQNALLASDNLLKHNLNEHFIIYKPKDIVSGDFYWATKSNNKFYMVTADSTGHGVPGAFMSLLNISFLNEAITEKRLLKPNEILDHARLRLISALKSDGSEEGGKDGMDCILIAFDIYNNKLEYSAANNSFFIIRNKELLLQAGDKMPVGRSPKDNEPFTLRTFELQKDDIIYTMTDGLQDQFGGPKGKKFKNKQLQELILNNSHLPLPEQKQIIETTFNNWKGKLEQLDDVCVIGIKI
ncbi:MAG: tetratricopeptide repeat protein [Bacteroidia bacterium]|nr:tetratricopeptide repeat protein [Bacteroidia bacterium]